MPPKALFDNSHRPDKLVVPACDLCNRTSSKADLTASIVSRWGYNSNEQELADHAKLARRAKFQAPELVAEWNTLAKLPVERKKARRHLEAYGVSAPRDAAITTIGTLTIRQLNIFAHKATLALYFDHFREPLTNEGRLHAYWRSKEDFAMKGVPQELIDLFPRYKALVQGVWSSAETFDYRYDVNVQGGLFGFVARLRQGLFVTGFALRSAAALNPELGGDWVKPNEILSALPHFDRKN